MERLEDDREVHELTLLFEVQQALSNSMDLRDVMLPVLRTMGEHMGLLRGMVTILNRETGEIMVEQAYGLTTKEQSRGKYQVGEGIIGSVVETGEVVVIPDISEEPRFLDRTRVRRGLKEEVISFLCIPVKVDEEVVGTLSADRHFASATALDNDMRLLSIIAGLISRAVKIRQKTQELVSDLERENIRLHEELKDRFRPANIIGNTRAIQNVYRLVENVSGSMATVLIRGESGTGKELVANAIHYNSKRAGKPFIKVNCGALPETVIENELFGHEKGAFTGAHESRKGRFELADGGTIFLDEIGEISLSTQVRLLRVLQEKEFERLGGVKTIKVDVRIIAATNRNLEKLIEEGRFRQDLYYRLNVFPIHVPPLRERKSDILSLVDSFIEKYSADSHKRISRISTPAIDMLMDYHWPGNVRELENCIERAVLLSNDGVIHGYHLPPSLQRPDISVMSSLGTLQDRLDAVEKEAIVEVIKSSSGSIAKAARILGITERIVGLRLKKYGIDPKDYKNT